MQWLPVNFKTLTIAMLSLVGALFWLFFRLPDNAHLTVSFLDVGQGDSILFRTPEQHLVLIDGGPWRTVLTELGNVLAPWERTIDLVILTHPDRDHIEGLLSVFEQYRVGMLLLSGAQGKFRWQEFLEQAQAQGTSVFFADSDRDFAVGETVFDVLYPFDPAIGIKTNVNEASVAVRIKFGEMYLLFSGDLGVGAENLLVNQPIDLCAQVFKLGHHGSRGSNDPRFLAAISPFLAVGSMGRGNSFDHPHAETLQRLRTQGVSNVFRTDRDGSVTLSLALDGDVSVATQYQGTRRITAPSFCNFRSSRS